MPVDVPIGEHPDRVPRACSRCGAPLREHTLRSLLVCHHGEKDGNEVADRISARLADPEERRRMAEQGAKAIAGMLEILQVIRDAPAEERPALVAHVKAELRRIRAAE